MTEPILNGIVLGLIPITIAGLLWSAYTQYKRSQRLFQEMVDMPRELPN